MEQRFKEASGDDKKSVINYLRRKVKSENIKQAPIVAYGIEKGSADIKGS